MKLNFVYIGNDWNGLPKENLPTDNMQVIEAKFDDGTRHLIPIIPNHWKKVDDIKEVFVYGQGCFKVNKKKRKEIPVFDGSVDHFKEYLEEYGIYALCYSINGDIFYCSDDCCNIRYNNEFSTLFKQLRDIQIKVLNEKYKSKFINHHYNNNKIYEFLFELSYNMGLSIFCYPVLIMDVMNDEKKMDELYEKIRYWELYEKHKVYPEYLKRKMQMIMPMDESMRK